MRSKKYKGAASMLAGAVASILGATEGGVLRDSKWYNLGWRATRSGATDLGPRSSAKAMPVLLWLPGMPLT